MRASGMIKCDDKEKPMMRTERQRTFTQVLSFAVLATTILTACVTVETTDEVDTITSLTETETNPAKPVERLLDHDEKIDCTSQVFSAGSKPLCK